MSEEQYRLYQLAEEAERDRLSQDLARARDQAEQAFSARPQFLSAITHELRTKLHGILGCAELLGLEGSLNPAQSARLAVITASGQHLLETIDSACAVPQTDADRLDLQPAETELSELIICCVNVIRPATDAKGLILNVAASTSLCVFVDPARLRQALVDLLGNAVKFTLAGSIEVRLRETNDGEHVRLEVAVTGSAFSPRRCNELFHVSEPRDARTIDAAEGIGSGVAFAARIIDLIGGTTGYADNPDGSRLLWFEHPRHRAVAGRAGPTGVLLDSPPRSLRVLVADDEAVCRDIAGALLINAGHEVVCVADGSEAVEAAAAQDYDVILMDVRMPRMNGLEATRRIRALPGPRGQVRVVAVTAQAFAQHREMCRQAGADCHVSKPFKQAVLLAAVENHHTVQDTPATAATSLADATIEATPDRSIFDREVFEDATSCLDASEIVVHLGTLVTRCDALVMRLCVPQNSVTDRDLVDDVHKLAGGAGVFGFVSIAAAARQLELAAETSVAEREGFADRLVASIGASMSIVRQELERAATSRIIN